MDEGLHELMETGNSDAVDSPDTAFIQNSADDESASEEDLKDVGQALADIDVDDNDSAF